MITLDLNLPFKKCEDCTYHRLDIDTVYADGRAYEAYVICDNELVCRNFARLVGYVE